MTPLPSEGADAAVDDLAADLNAWIGQLGELQRKAARVSRLAYGTTSELKARTVLRALNHLILPIAISNVRTTAQQARDTASARATSDAVGVALEMEAEHARGRL